MKTFLRIISRCIWCIWWHLLFPFLIVITPALFATNVNIPYFGKPFRTCLFTALPTLNPLSRLPLKEKVSISLEKLPTEVKFSDNFKNRITYSNSQLVFTGVMSKKEKIKLLKLSKDDLYKGAVKKLYLKSQRLPYHFWSTIKCANFDLIPLSKGFIAINEACALLPLIFFISVFLAHSISFVFKEIYLLRLGIILPILFLIIPVLLYFLREYTSIVCILLVLYLSIWLLSCLICFYNYIPKQNKPISMKVRLFAEIRYRFFITNRYLASYIKYRHPVACLAGIFYNTFVYIYLCIVVANYDNGNLPPRLNIGALPFFVIWSTSLAMWMGPFVRAWLRVFSTDFVDEYYRKTLSQIISGLDEHQVLLGFGGLGKGVRKELLEREKRNPLCEPLYPLYEPFLDPSDGSSIRYLAKNMVVVDRDERLFDKVFVDPALERIGIAKLKYDNITYSANSRFNITKEEIWIPAVIGDFIDESVIDNCALGRCEFFIDTIEGYEESIRISKFAHDHPKPNGIITVSDSAQQKFLFPRHSGQGVFLTYPTQQRGISLGEVVYPAMARYLNDDNNFHCPNVLVFTDELRQTHYMIETILQELKMGGHLGRYLVGRHSPDSQEPVDLGITICGEADEIKRVCHPKIPQSISPDDMDERRWVEIIERCANPEYAWSGKKYYIESRVILEKPHLMTMEKIIDKLEPRIVVISYKNTADILKVLHDWIIAVERYNSPLSQRIENDGKINLPYHPKIIVGYQGEEERDVRDWLQYYDTLCRNSDAKWQKYPLQAIDCMVDLNKDSKENIAAIAEAMYKNK